MFTDPDFDGFPEFMSQEEIDEWGNRVPDSQKVLVDNEIEETIEYEPPELDVDREVDIRKFYVDGVEVHIVHEMAYELDP